MTREGVPGRNAASCWLTMSATASKGTHMGDGRGRKKSSELGLKKLGA